MWTIVLFDLPTDTDEARKRYTAFRKHLLNDGYIMMQYSVYMRHHASTENATVHTERVKRELPPDGEVRILKITDKQFSLMEVYFGKNRKRTEQPPGATPVFLVPIPQKNHLPSMPYRNASVIDLELPANHNCRQVLQQLLESVIDLELPANHKLHEVPPESGCKCNRLRTTGKPQQLDAINQYNG